MVAGFFCASGGVYDDGFFSGEEWFNASGVVTVCESVGEDAVYPSFEYSGHTEPPEGVDEGDDVGVFDYFLVIEDIFWSLCTVEGVEVIIGEDGVEVFGVEVEDGAWVSFFVGGFDEGL